MIWIAPLQRTFLMIGLMAVSCGLSWGGTVVSDAFVEAVAQIESGGGRETVGDGGRARGWWQMHEAAWQDTSDYRARRGVPTWNYDQAQDPEVARLYARDYLTILENQIRAATGAQPDVELIYAAYNVGFGRLQSLNFDIEKTRSITQFSCARLRQLIAATENTVEPATSRAKTGCRKSAEAGANENTFAERLFTSQASVQNVRGIRSGSPQETWCGLYILSADGPLSFSPPTPLYENLPLCHMVFLAAVRRFSAILCLSYRVHKCVAL